MTEGQYRVGTNFNPSSMPEVDHVKAVIAELIDYIFDTGKDSRCNSIVATELESAAMWAVKSFTKEPR